MINLPKILATLRAGAFEAETRARQHRAAGFHDAAKRCEGLAEGLAKAESMIRSAACGPFKPDPQSVDAEDSQRGGL